MEKIYNLGIIGFGGMAGHHFNQLAKQNTRVRVRGVFDLDPSRLQAAQEKGVLPYPSREALLSDPEIDIVLVATTNESHAEICEDALRHGKHVLCEKPATMTSDELLKVMAVAKECQKVFTIDQNRRVNKDFVLMRRQVESGIIGKPYVIESRVEGSRGMPSGWRHLKALGGGMMLDWGVHLIDQILYMSDASVTDVYCKMYSLTSPEVEDNFRLTMTLSDGMTAHIEVSTNNFILHPRWYVLGTKGTLQIDDWSCKGQVICPIADQSQWSVEIAPDRSGPSKTMAKRDPATVQITDLSAPTDVEDNLDPTYRQLIQAIEGGELTIKPEEALRVIKVMEAAFASAQTGEVIHLNV
jgi:predicted dehydrogenase